MTNEPPNSTPTAAQSSPLIGNKWRQEVQSYLAQNPGARAIQIAQALGCSEAEALATLSSTVFDLSAEILLEVLAEIRTWEQVFVLVRNREAVAELTVPADIWYIKGDWLNWIDDTNSLHINIAATERILGLIRSGKHGSSHSFNLVNRQGHVFCRFYTRTPSATDSFLAFCQRFEIEKK